MIMPDQNINIKLLNIQSQRILKLLIMVQIQAIVQITLIFVHPVAGAVNDNKVDLGILICGSGNGVCMTANKYKNVRAGLCWNEEIVELIKLHNNANILCIPARYITLEEAVKFVEIFLNTKFEGGRHQSRIDKIPISC